MLGGNGRVHPLRGSNVTANEREQDQLVDVEVEGSNFVRKGAEREPVDQEIGGREFSPTRLRNFCRCADTNTKLRYIL